MAILIGIVKNLHLFKSNATMNHHDSQLRNNEPNNLDSNISLLKSVLEAFKFIYVLKIFQLMIV